MSAPADWFEGSLYLGQTTTVDFSPLVKALAEAGVTGWIFVFVLSIVIIGLIVRSALINDRHKTDSSAKVTEALTAAITTLTTNVTTLTNNQMVMQTGSQERDKQIRQMSDIQQQQVTASGEQNKLLSEQTEVLKELKEITTTGHDYTKKLTETIVGSTQDTSTVIQALDKSVKDTSDVMKSRFDNLPADIAAALEGHFRLIRDDIARMTDPDLATKVVNSLRPDVVAMFDKALAKCLEENAAMAHELDKTETVLDDTKQELDKVARAKLLASAAKPDDTTPPDPGTKAPIPFPPPDDSAPLTKTGTDGGL